MMNERIKELMGKTLDSEFSHTWDTMTYEGLLQFADKFAELIIRECARIVPNTDLEDVEGGDSAVLMAASKQIKKHFGVE